METTIEKNVLTASGKPGSVDKGEREERGLRLWVSTNKPTKETKVIMPENFSYIYPVF